MAKRGREGVLKRQREKARQEKQIAKREKRQSRSDDGNDEPEIDENRLMEEFARLSQRFEDSEISVDRYEEERRRIFVELGIESNE
ncbi:MAG: hypothetical protein ACRDU9_04145 [Acidimicrobiia bacterium]